MTQIARRDVLRAGAGGAALLAVGWPQAAAGAARGIDRGAGTVIEWNRMLLAILRTPGAHPATVHPTRSFVMLQAAVHDAVTAPTGKHRPYQYIYAGVHTGLDHDAGQRLGRDAARFVVAARAGSPTMASAA